MARIGLLPGTFDPIHFGHIELARTVMAERELDEVLLAVNPEPAHKTGVTELRHRVAMADLAVRDVDGIRVYQGQHALAPHVPGTFVEIAQELGGDCEFVIGIDNFVTLDRWQGVESVVKNATYAVARRRGAGEAEVADLRQRLGELGKELRVNLFDLASHREASSSVVRGMVRAGERPEWLDERVYKYILAHALYL